MLLLDLWSSALFPSELAAAVHGPAISHYQNTQVLLCSNPIRLLFIYQVSFEYFHSFPGSSENSICSIWLLLKKPGRLFQIHLCGTLPYHLFCFRTVVLWHTVLFRPFSPDSSNLPSIMKLILLQCLSKPDPVGRWKNTGPLVNYHLKSHHAPPSSCLCVYCILPHPPQLIFILSPWLDAMLFFYSFSSHLLMACTLCSFRTLSLILKSAWFLQSDSYNFKNPFRNSKSPELTVVFYLCNTALIILIFLGAKGASDLMEGASQSALWRWSRHKGVGRLLSNSSKES